MYKTRSVARDGATSPAVTRPPIAILESDDQVLPLAIHAVLRSDCLGGEHDERNGKNKTSRCNSLEHDSSFTVRRRVHARHRCLRMTAVIMARVTVAGCAGSGIPPL